jgi:branched-chain amino acid transport system ATP-binding protein
MTLLRTEGLTKDFGGLRAVDHVSFELPKGEIRAVIGPNGAGKTTFVSLLSGRLQPSAGRVFLEGSDITGMPAHRRVRLGIAYTFQITSVFQNLTMLDNVVLAAQRDQTANAETAALEALERVRLRAYATAVAGAQSYGHQRLLEIAMGIALKPKLLILDEPTQGLAAGEIDGFCALIRDLSRDTTILMIEHNMDVVMALAERITVLDQGAVLSDGSPEAITADAAVQAAYLGA